MPKSSTLAVWTAKALRWSSISTTATPMVAATSSSVSKRSLAALGSHAPSTALKLLALLAQATAQHQWLLFLSHSATSCLRPPSPAVARATETLLPTVHSKATTSIWFTVRTTAVPILLHLPHLLVATAGAMTSKTVNSPTGLSSTLTATVKTG